MKILIAGFQHETNTFSPVPTEFDDFARGGAFPAMNQGEGVLALANVDVPMGGFLRTARSFGWEYCPTVWAGATPAGPVSADAFERIASVISNAARRSELDGIYLDLHGAMLCAHLDDGEGELLARLRDIVGPDVPIVASLDLHANVTERMLALASALIAYRTYPHKDMAETGSRAARMLQALVSRGRPFERAFRTIPFLIPINAMATEVPPAREVYTLLQQLETRSGIESLSIALGFPACDFPECGGMIWGYGGSRAVLEDALDRLERDIVDREADWNVSFLSPEEAVRKAIAIAQFAKRPVIIADTQDNPGAGGSSDSMGLLRTMVALGAEDAAIGLIVDGDAAKRAHDAGVGAELELALGGKSGATGDTPFHGRFRVEYLSEGRCTFEGPYMRGKQADVGPSARLAIHGVKIVVCSGTDQMLDRSFYRMVDIEPEAMKILVNKSSVHFRADFDAIAEAILVAKAPGLVAADPGDLPWARLAPTMRVRPGGPTFAELHAAKQVGPARPDPSSAAV